MTQIKSIQDLPKLKLEMELFETSKPYKEKDGSVYYFTTFCFAHCDVGNKDINGLGCMGSIDGSDSGGMFLRYNLKDGSRVEFFLPPDDAWIAVAKAAGIWDQIKQEPDKSFEGLKAQSIKERPKPTRKPKTKKLVPKSEPELEKAIHEPDWNRDRHITGGGIDPGIPKPYVWHYPHNGIRRRVTIHLMRYPGKPHTFLDIREEDNSVWDPFEAAWRDWPGIEGHRGRDIFDFKEIADRNVHKGETVGSEFNSYAEAKAIARLILDKYFPEDQYESNWEDYGYDDSRTAEREGD